MSSGKFVTVVRAALARADSIRRLANPCRISNRGRNYRITRIDFEAARPSAGIDQYVISRDRWRPMG